MTPIKTFEIAGRLQMVDSGEAVCVLGVDDEVRGQIILAEVLQSGLAEAQASVARRRDLVCQASYFVTERAIAWETLEVDRIRMVMGDPSADFRHVYSDLTGYLWTEEQFVVNDHDIIAEIYQNSGGENGFKWVTDAERPEKYLRLRLEYFVKD
jgi:hypothetical protein